VLVALFALVATSCVRTKITSFKDPDYAGRMFSRPAVVADIGDLRQRQTFEASLGAELAKRGVPVWLSTQIIPPTREYSPEQRMQMLTSAGMDSLIVVSVSGEGMVQQYVPPSGTTTTTGAVQTQGNQAVYEEQTRTTYQGGYYVGRPWQHVTTRVLDTLNRRVAWVAETRSTGDIQADTDDLIHAYAKKIANELVSQNVFYARGRSN
jgi:hypothetical protein